MSIGFTEFDRDKRRQVWRALDRLFSTKVQVWQNGFSHDVPWLQYIGFSFDLSKVHDTLVRHWVLWPELSHKLEFQTFQYTRECYYKDEGRNWSPKEGKAKLKTYNCKDAAVTLEIFRSQEAEFAARTS
jgi:hypothetical protein